jgi:hypothetical protein
MTGSSKQGFSSHAPHPTQLLPCLPSNLHLHLLLPTQVSQEEWDAVVSAQAEVNPFLKWAFLNALEVSGSAVSSTLLPAVLLCSV